MWGRGSLATAVLTLEKLCVVADNMDLPVEETIPRSVSQSDVYLNVTSSNPSIPTLRNPQEFDLSLDQ